MFRWMVWVASYYCHLVGFIIQGHIWSKAPLEIHRKFGASQAFLLYENDKELKTCFCMSRVIHIAYSLIFHRVVLNAF